MKTIYKLFTILVFTFGISSIWSQNTIVFEKKEHQFGDVRMGDLLECTFTFTNTSKSEVSIQKVRASTGAIVPSYSKLPIAPGEKSSIGVKYANRTLGSFTKSITISFENNESYVLRIKGCALGHYSVVTENNLYGVKDNWENKLVVPYKYSSLDYYYNDTYLAQMKGKYGIINLKNKTIIPFEYDRFVSKKPLTLSSKKEVSIAVKNSKYGVVDMKNKILIPFVYNEIDTLLYVFKAKKENNYGLIGENNNIIVPFIYEEIEASGSRSFYIVTKNNKVGAYNNNGRLVIPVEYDYLKDYDDDGYFLAAKENRHGVIDYYNNVTVPFVYKHQMFFRGGLSCVKDGKSFGAINKRNKLVIPCQYEEPFMFFGVEDSLYAVTKQNGKYGIIDRNNRIIIPYEYDSLVTYKNIFAIVMVLKERLEYENAFIIGFKNGQRVAIDKNNRVVKKKQDVTPKETKQSNATRKPQTSNPTTKQITNNHTPIRPNKPDTKKTEPLIDFSPEYLVDKKPYLVFEFDGVEYGIYDYWVPGEMQPYSVVLKGKSKEIISPNSRYTLIKPMYDDHNNIQWLKVSNKDGIGASDIYGNVMIAPDKENRSVKFEFGRFFVNGIPTCYGLDNSSLQMIVLDNTSSLLSRPIVSPGYFETCDKDGHRGVIDAKGKTIISIDREYDSIGYVSGYFIFSQNGYYGLCNAKGDEVIKTEREYIYLHPTIRHKSTYFFCFRKKNFEGLCDAVGHIVIPESRYYSSIETIYTPDGWYYKVKKFGKYGVCNLDGEEIIAPQYKSIDYKSGQFYSTDQNGKSDVLPYTIKGKNSTIKSLK